MFLNNTSYVQNNFDNIKFSGFGIVTPAENPDASEGELKLQAFYRDVLPNLEHDRQGVIKHVEEITGFKIHDQGSYSIGDIEIALNTLIRHANGMKSMANKDIAGPPDGVKHVVLGHGIGIDDHWRFLGSGQTVQDYVNQTVPSGEQAWAIVCDSYNSRDIHEGQGTIVTSKN